MDDKQIVTETRPGVVEEFIDNSAVEETDALAADVISQIVGEYEAEDLEALPDAAPAEGEAEETPAVEATAEEAPEEGGAVEEEKPEEDRGLERLVAREVAVREAETALKVREAKLAEVEKENAALKEQLSAFPTDFVEEMRVRPWEALEAAGHDPDHVVRLILASKMQKEGKQVPQELRQAIRDAEYDYKLRSQERELQAMKQQAATQAFVAKVESEARQYVTKGISKDAPTVAQVAKANPERVFAEILDEIGRDAQARAREPGAQLISHDEAARRVEKRWSEMRALFGVTPPTENPEDKASTTAGKTKSTTPAPGASTKQTKTPQPLTKPKAKTQKELEDEGIEAALAEFKRSEQARKPARA